MTAQYVQLSDLQGRYGGPLPDEDQADVLLGDAEDEIRLELRRARRDLDADIASGALGLDTVVRVACEIVASVLRNPSGARSGTSTKTEGPFSSSESFTLSEHARGELGLTDRHRRMLGLSSGGAFTVRPSGRAPVLR